MSALLYRAMEADADGLPKVGAARNMLGVRPGIDMRAAPKDAAGQPLAGPGRGGPSVNVDDWKRMPATIRPKHFGGHNSLTTMYQAKSCCLSPASLVLGEIHEVTKHAMVESAEECSIEDFQARISSTRPSWKRAERPGLEP